MYLSREIIYYLRLVLFHVIHLYHRPFRRQVHLPWVLKNCFQEWGFQNWFQGLPYVSKSLWKFPWHCSAIEKKRVKHVLKLVYHAKMMCLHVLKFYLMFLICYFKLPLCFLYISLCFLNFCSYKFVNLTWIKLLGYIIFSSFIMIPFNTTTMILRWTLLIQNTHLVISWKIPILMN